VEIKSVTTNIDGLKIRHLEGGEGDMPLVFLHAFFTNAESFRGLIGFLGERYRVYVPDYPGFGQSDQLETDWDFEQINQVMVKWFRRLDLKEIVLAGASFGGTNIRFLAPYIDDLVLAYILIQPYSGYSALKFSPSLVKKSRRISKLLDRLIPSKLGDFVWNSDNLMAFVINTIDPLQETERGFHERINGLRTARFKTFVHTLGEILSLNIDVKKYLTQKPTILIMSATDDSLIYDVTQRTFQALFPNITEIPINLVQHNPIEPLTTDYFKRNFLYLLSTIDNLTLKARTQMSKP